MTTLPIAAELFSWPDRPRLIGSSCAACATTTFPAQQSCPRCTGTDLRAVPLATTGRLWTWTIQGFEPKPPYAMDGPFEPYGVGYIELAAEDGGSAAAGSAAAGSSPVLVESRLTEAEPAPACRSARRWSWYSSRSAVMTPARSS